VVVMKKKMENYVTENVENESSDNIKVSVIMITYNQEEFVAQAIESILMQKVEFQYEILIGDDASSDNTPNIIMEYYEQYPDIIVPILREENIGVSRNSYDLLMRARGEYISNLEGDDYWTSQDKLQFQVDFLEEHLDFVGCTHRFMTVDHTNKVIEKNPQWTFQGREYSWEQFLSWLLPSQTGTWLYRNIYLDKTIDWTVIYKASPVASDTTTLLLLLQYGRIYNIDRYMSNYRRDYRSTSTSWSAVPIFTRRLNIYEMSRYYEKYALEKMNKKIRFTNTESILTSLFIMCCDHPSKYKLDCVNNILNELEGEEKEKYSDIMYELMQKHVLILEWYQQGTTEQGN